MAAGSGAAFDEVPDSVYTHTEIQATHANTHGISIGIGYPGFYARKVNGDYPSVLVEHRAAASASRSIEVVLNHDIHPLILAPYIGPEVLEDTTT